jgi:hypothetical protein
MAKRTRVYTFTATGWDLYRAHSLTPDTGTRVVKTQPAGCPRNGTMGQCYVMDADTGEFYGMVALSSLTATGEMVETPMTAAERVRAERDARRAGR